MFTFDLSDQKNDNFTRRLNLDNEDFDFVFNYNSYGDFWSLKILDSNGSIALLTKIVCNFDFLSLYQYKQSIPKGRVIFKTNNKNQSRPGYLDFQNGSVFIVYISETEL